MANVQHSIEKSLAITDVALVSDFFVFEVDELHYEVARFIEERELRLVGRPPLQAVLNEALENS